MRIGFLLCLLAWAMSTASFAAATQNSAKNGASSSKSVLSNNDRFVDEVIELTNQERVKAGLAPLKRQDDLSKAARWLAEDMAANGYFDHKDRQGRHIEPRLPDFGYTGYALIGENIAAGQPRPAEVVAAWLKSPGHRANLLNPDFREIGVACVHAPNSEFQDYWVQDFGSRTEVFPLIINMEAAQTKSPDVKLYVHGSQWAQKARFSNDGEHWTKWEAYQPSRDWTLAETQGKQTVYVELSNGRDSKRQTASIELVSASKTASAAPVNTKK